MIVIQIVSGTVKIPVPTILFTMKAKTSKEIKAPAVWGLVDALEKSSCTMGSIFFAMSEGE